MKEMNRERKEREKERKREINKERKKESELEKDRHWQQCCFIYSYYIFSFFLHFPSDPIQL